MGRTLVIGDIHGYADALDGLLEEVSPGDDDQLIFIGDYVDKGPDVRRVLDCLVALHDSRPQDIYLLGNHDLLMLQAAEDRKKVPEWESLAGNHPLASYGNDSTEELLGGVVPEAHIAFLRDVCVRYHTTDTHIFVHGGIRPEIPPEQEDDDHLLWQKITSAEPHSSRRTVICGHTSQESGLIVDLEHTICIDTGITRGRWLTCLDAFTLQFWQVDREGNSVTHGKLREH